MRRRSFITLLGAAAGLRELGWNEGRNVATEYRWADAVSERYSDIAADLVRLRPDIIFTAGTLTPRAACRRRPPCLGSELTKLLRHCFVLSSLDWEDW
jgi:hypothetical protein